MAGVFSRSWHITKLSFRVIKQDKELLLFPILAGIFSIIFIFAMLFPTLIVGILGAAGFIGFTFFHCSITNRKVCLEEKESSVFKTSFPPKLFATSQPI